MKRFCSIILGWMPIIAAAPIAAQSGYPAGHVTVVVHPDLQTGKLIRSVLVQPKEVLARLPEVLTRVHEPLAEPVSSVTVPLSSNIIEMIDQIARTYDVEGSPGAFRYPGREQL